MKSSKRNLSRINSNERLAKELLRLGAPQRVLEILKSETTNKKKLSRSVELLKVRAHENIGNVEPAIQILLRLLKFFPDDVQILTQLFFLSLFTENLTRTQRTKISKNLAKCFSKQVQFQIVHNNERNPNKIIHLGLITGDFCEHPVGFLMSDVFCKLRGTTIRVFIYDTLEIADQSSDKVKSQVFSWCPAKSFSDQELIKKIKSDKIDILGDLHGITKGGRPVVMAHRPAPISFQAWGLAATSCVQEIDYSIVDRKNVVPENVWEFVEKILYVNNTYLCFSKPNFNVDIGLLPADRNGYITFGAINKITKISNTVLITWSRILKRVPDSRLVVRAESFKSKDCQLNFLARAKRAGINIERINLLGPANRFDSLSTYRDVDIMLDTFPYGGITSLVEALWVGVPVVTLSGQRMVSRMSNSILSACKMEKFLTQSLDEYVRLAIYMANNPTLLRRWRKQQRKKIESSDLMNSNKYAKNFEKLMRSLWTQWCKKPPNIN